VGDFWRGFEKKVIRDKSFWRAPAVGVANGRETEGAGFDPGARKGGGGGAMAGVGKLWGALHWAFYFLGGAGEKIYRFQFSGGAGHCGPGGTRGGGWHRGE